VLALGVAVLAGLTALALRSGPTARAAGAACTPCVILIQVDGLEPKDVTPQTTPYLWALAHPKLAGNSVPGGALAGRSGFVWQAPRGVVTTGTAPATASLLTGAYPEKAGVTADEFYGPTADASLAHLRLGADGFGDRPESALPDHADAIGAPAVDTVLGAAAETTKVAAFLGDPGVAGVAAASSAETYWFPPGTPANANEPASAKESDDQTTGDPRLCPIPRYPDGGQQATPDQRAFDPHYCPANDLTTTNKAFTDLSNPKYANVGLTFIHLAELGAAKRLAGRNSSVVPNTAPPPDPGQALADADHAIATFVEHYVSDPVLGDKWKQTVLMVVGSHGYQTTPASHRAPDIANPTDQTKDLSDYVKAFNSDLTLVPQGTLATVYYKQGGDGPTRAAALKAIKDELAGKLDAACEARVPTTDHSGCLAGIHYVDKDTPGTDDTLATKHPTWRLDARNPKNGQRIGGDLVIELKRGWAFGRAVGAVGQAGLDPIPFSNPNPGSSGGPQERAVAALIDGPDRGTYAVRNLDTLASPQEGAGGLAYYPVSNHDVDASDNNHPPVADPPANRPCPDTNTDPGGLACANDPATVGDDPRTKGHQAQPETVDFAITITALMQLPFQDPTQLQGRVLQEAFLGKFDIPREEEEKLPPICTDVGAATVRPDPAVIEFNCEEPKGAPMTYSVVNGPAHGRLGPITANRVAYTANDGFSGVDTFTYRATSANGESDINTASVVVADPPVVIRPPEFDFYGLIRRLKALVVDSGNRPWVQARRGATLSSIRLEADFGRPETALTLTFYKRTRVNGRVVRLKSIARFDPFVVKRGHVVMRFKVPAQFKPNYIGVTVREVARAGNRRLRTGEPCTTLHTFKPVPFRCTGPSGGQILPIADARRLHKRKPGGRAPVRRR
jgi:hypothetical protein